MFCSNCGSKLPDGVKFCSVCGARVAEATPAPAPARMSKSFDFDFSEEGASDTSRKPAEAPAKTRVTFDWSNVIDEPLRKTIPDIKSPWSTTGGIDENELYKEMQPSTDRSRTMSFIDVLKAEKEQAEAEKSAAKAEEPQSFKYTEVLDPGIYDVPETPAEPAPELHFAPLFDDVDEPVHTPFDIPEEDEAEALEAEKAVIDEPRFEAEEPQAVETEEPAETEADAADEAVPEEVAAEPEEEPADEEPVMEEEHIGWFDMPAFLRPGRSSRAAASETEIPVTEPAEVAAAEEIETEEIQAEEPAEAEAETAEEPAQDYYYTDPEMPQTEETEIFEEPVYDEIDVAPYEEPVAYEDEYLTPQDETAEAEPEEAPAEEVIDERDIYNNTEDEYLDIATEERSGREHARYDEEEEDEEDEPETYDEIPEYEEEDFTEEAEKDEPVDEAELFAEIDAAPKKTGMTIAAPADRESEIEALKKRLAELMGTDWVDPAPAADPEADLTLEEPAFAEPETAEEAAPEMNIPVLEAEDLEEAATVAGAEPEQVAEPEAPEIEAEPIAEPEIPEVEPEPAIVEPEVPEAEEAADEGKTSADEAVPAPAEEPAAQAEPTIEDILASVLAEEGDYKASEIPAEVQPEAVVIEAEPEQAAEPEMPEIPEIEQEAAIEAEPAPAAEERELTIEELLADLTSAEPEAVTESAEAEPEISISGIVPEDITAPEAAPAEAVELEIPEVEPAEITLEDITAEPEPAQEIVIPDLAEELAAEPAVEVAEDKADDVVISVEDLYMEEPAAEEAAPEEAAPEEPVNKETDALTLEELEQDLFGEVMSPAAEAEATKKIDKFYTLYRKNEEFQRLLDEEYNKLKSGSSTPAPVPAVEAAPVAETKAKKIEDATIYQSFDLAQEIAKAEAANSQAPAKETSPAPAAAAATAATAAAAAVTAAAAANAEAPEVEYEEVDKGGGFLTVLAVIIAILLVILLAVILVLHLAPESGIALKIDAIIQNITSHFSMIDAVSRQYLL